MDILVAEIYVLSVAAVLLITGGGMLIALLFVILVPGYVLVATIFPTNDRIDWFERLALSIGLSIAVVPTLGLILSFTPVGIGFESTLVSILAFSVVFGILAYIRRIQMLTRSRGLPVSRLKLPRWRDFSGQEKALAAGLSIAVALSTIVVITALSNSSPVERFTEFGLLGPGGELTGFPTRLNVSEEGTLIIFVRNHESETVNYTVQVYLIELVELTNGTSEINRTSINLFNLTLFDGREWVRTYTFSIGAPGPWEVEFLLFRDGDMVRVYRSLNIFVRVTSPQ